MQVASSGGVKRLYSRAGEDVSGAFPDIVEAIDFDGVFDGELLVRREEAWRRSTTCSSGSTARA